MQIEIVKLRENAIIPTYGTELAAGADLYAAIDNSIKIDPHGTEMVPTGIALSIPEGYFGGVYARSGLSSKEGLRPANCVGVVDADYTGEIMVAVHNDCDGTYKVISPGQRIAQLVIQPYLKADFELVEALEETDRGAGGFGSTGTN